MHRPPRVAEVTVARPFAGVLAAQVLAEHVRGGDGGFVFLLMAPQGRDHHHHRLLHALRQLGHAALAVGQL